MKKVSCLCPTYGRCPEYQWCLEEAVESFLRQDYPEKELIILNDCGSQTLVCDIPSVHVFNVPEKYLYLGSKYNAMASLATGELLCPWEDDDISLSHRISLSVARLEGHSYFNPQGYFVAMGSNPAFCELPAKGYAHNCSIFTRAAWAKVAGYAPISGPQDARMDFDLRSLNDTVSGLSSRKEVFYVYRFGIHPYHLSGFPNTEEAYRNAPCGAGGKYVLLPHWRADYDKLTEGP